MGRRLLIKPKITVPPPGYIMPEEVWVISCNEERLNQFVDAYHDDWPALRVHWVERDENPFRGCWKSHFDVLRKAEGVVAIFEDDCVFTDDFTFEAQALDDNWDLFYYGGYAPDRDRKQPGVVSVRSCMNTHAYVARQPWKVAGLLGPPGAPSPFDDVVHVDHMLGRHLPLVRYALNPPTAGQRGGVKSDITDGVRMTDDYFVVEQ